MKKITRKIQSKKSSTKDWEGLYMRIPSEELAMIREAAEIKKESICKFVMDEILPKAQAVLNKEYVKKKRKELV